MKPTIKHPVNFKVFLDSDRPNIYFIFEIYEYKSSNNLIIGRGMATSRFVLFVLYLGDCTNSARQLIILARILFDNKTYSYYHIW